MEKNFSFENASGETVSPHEAVFPICKSLPNGDFMVVGTGFYVNNSGLFMTAAHVVEEPTSGDLFIPHLLTKEPGNNYLPRSALSVVAATDADIAVVATPPVYHNTTGEQLVNKNLVVTTKVPDRGESIFCYSYPETIVHQYAENQWISIVLPRWTEGLTEEYFPNGRDRVMQPGSCYQVKMDVPGGSSGGPVMNLEGMVWGVVSSGIVGADVMYVAPILKILDTPTVAVSRTGELTGGRLRDFMPVDLPRQRNRP